MEDTNLYVLTGGPGAGKTTLLRELERLGYGCVDEVARKLIQDEVHVGGDALPWVDTATYAETMLEREISSYRRTVPLKTITFCDRGMPDTLCYMRLIEHEDAAAMQACREYRYARRVFVATPWKEIYTVDEERRQSFDEAVHTCALLAKVYAESGYEVVELPLASVEERAEFVLRNL